MRRCPRCLRANPKGAAFCHHDGVPLDTGFFGASNHFSREWRFPAGKPCRTIDELASECLTHWAEARNALVRRDFVSFFQEVNRADLAAMVPPPEPDSELALQAFLEKLPTQKKVAPSLDVAPRRLHIPDARAGEQRRVFLTIINRGTGLLHGEISGGDSAGWARPATNRLRTRTEQPIEITLDTRALPPVGSYFARMQVRTNGGAVEVPIQIDLSQRGVMFQGHTVADPRDLAKVMLASPKLGARWLADGSLKRLFATEGWDYPLTGRLSPSLGAVQQYFEALKLSSIPAVSADVAEFNLTLDWPGKATRAVTLSVKSKKWVYAFVESGALWLKPHATTVSGPRQVDVLFDVDSELLEPGRAYEAVLELEANGGQILQVLVRVDVRRPYEPATRKLLRPFS